MNTPTNEPVSLQALPSFLQSRYVSINGCKLHYVENKPVNHPIVSDKDSKQNADLMVFLHGFPEYWRVWEPQLEYFSAQYHVIAPDLPGYHLSEKPSDSAFYEVPNLIALFASFIEHIANGRKVILIAHDWGGAIAWPLAAFHSHLFERLVILNAAHPSTFTREMIQNSAQRLKSEYIHELIKPNAVADLAANNCQKLQDKIFKSMSEQFIEQVSASNAGHCHSNAATLEAVRQDYIQHWQQDGVINGMLQYYRAMPQLAPPVAKTKQVSRDENKQGTPVRALDEMKIPEIRIHVPTLVLWGEQDQAFVVNNLDDLDKYVEDLKIIRFPNASHWLQHECPLEINRAITEFLH